MTALLREVELLYEGCVADPDRWGEQAFTDWAEGIRHLDGLDKRSSKYVRRAMQAGRRMAEFWRDTGTAVAPVDWRSRVDVALGPRAWRPLLELAEVELERTRSESAFDVVSHLFPLVRNQPFLDGVDYDEWIGTGSST